MEYVKRKILLESSVNRMTGSTYGDLTATTFNVPIFLSQKFDDIGMYTDEPFTPINKLNFIPDTIFSGTRPPGVTADMFYGPNALIEGKTDDSHLSVVKSYNLTTPYEPDLNMAENIHYRYDGVISYNQGTGIVEYVIGGDIDINVILSSGGNLSGYIAGTGVMFTTFLNSWITDIDPDTGEVLKTYQKTTYRFNSKGRTELNTTLSALIKQEEFLGVVFPQEVQSDVFIERGGEDIFEKHMVMAEIKTVEDIDNYRSGYLININV